MITQIRPVLLAVVLLSAIARADFTFVHTSDTHFGAAKNHEIDAEFFKEISALDPKPAFVVNTGDVCEIGGDDEYELYRNAVKHLTLPIYDAPGNHDVRWNPRGKEGFVRGTGSPLFRSWDFENVHFVTLDSTVLLNHWGHISRQQLDWLSGDLEKVGPDKPVIIGFHHWVGRDTVQVDNEAELLKVVDRYNVVLWLQGHGHSDIKWNVNGTPAMMQKGLYQGSYSVVNVNSDELSVKRRSWAKASRSDDLVRDKSIPTTQTVEWDEVFKRIPLKKQPRPNWEAAGTYENGRLDVAAKLGDLPADATLEVRVEGDQLQPMAGSSAAIRAAGVDVTRLVPGEYSATVQATLSNGRKYQKPIAFTVPGPVRPIWRANVGGEVQSRMLRDTASNSIFVPSMGGSLVALDPTTGSEKFRVKTGDSVFSSPHVDGGTVYFGSADHFVYAADTSTGNVKWKTETGGAVLAGPSVARGVVCVGSTDTKVYGLDAATGTVRWTVQGRNMYQSKVATDGERFFVGGWDNRFRCIDAETGKELWALKLGKSARNDTFSAFSPAIASPAVGDGQVFVSTNDGRLHAIDIASGKENWNIDWAKMGYSSPLYRDGKVYCALSDEGKVFCADAKTGSFIWQAEVGAVIYDSSFCFGGGNVFISSVSGIATAFDAATGERVWQYRLPRGHVLASPAADDSMVYFGSMNGTVTALPAR